MRLSILTSLIFATSILLPAQDKDVTILPVPYPNFIEVKTYLGLNDSQLQSLESTMNARNQAQQSIYNQINQKNQQIYQLLDSGSGSATQIGQLMIDIKNLEKQLPTLDGPFRTQAQNVLTADQKTKLAKLAEAMQLQTPAWQAATLLLIEYPRPIGIPMPVDATSNRGGVAGAAGVGIVGVPAQAGPMIFRR
jgi:septal ring factor EnvC (AmiA/AmiB activator)